MNRIKVSVRDDALLRASEKSVKNAQLNWRQRWKWIVQDYRDMQNDLAEISATKSKMGEKPQEPDNRTLKPFPETSNAVVGWISTKEGFKLELNDPDVLSIPLPNEYKLIY